MIEQSKVICFSSPEDVFSISPGSSSLFLLGSFLSFVFPVFLCFPSDKTSQFYPVFINEFILRGLNFTRGEGTKGQVASRYRRSLFRDESV